MALSRSGASDQKGLPVRRDRLPPTGFSPALFVFRMCELEDGCGQGPTGEVTDEEDPQVAEFGQSHRRDASRHRRIELRRPKSRLRKKRRSAP